MFLSLHLYMLGAFEKWAEYVEEEKRMREIQNWNAEVDALQAQRLKFILMKIQNSHMQKAWGQWHEMLVVSR